MDPSWISKNMLSLIWVDMMAEAKLGMLVST